MRGSLSDVTDRTFFGTYLSDHVKKISVNPLIKIFTFRLFTFRLFKDKFSKKNSSMHLADCYHGVTLYTTMIEKISFVMKFSVFMMARKGTYFISTFHAKW